MLWLLFILFIFYEKFTCRRVGAVLGFWTETPIPSPRQGALRCPKPIVIFGVFMNYAKRSLILMFASLFVASVALTGCATTSEKAPETATPAAKTATTAKPAATTQAKSASQATSTQTKQVAAPVKKAICPPKKKK
jgi:hypothetical protein